MSQNRLLITGGGGFIGSHTVVQLLEAGYEPLVLDNLSNCSENVFKRIEQIAGKPARFIEGDVRDRDLLEQLFKTESIHAVIHFAGLKAVGESVEQPLNYYQNNVTGSLVLFDVMQRYQCKRLVFSSSATVYGKVEDMPVTERCPLSATNPYGRCKLMVEEMLRDICLADPEWEVALLRYFNPVGAHKSGLIGEDPVGIPNNLLPYVAKVASGQLPELKVFGGDYPTVDGTGVRDYIHVVDLARGHLDALKVLTGGHGCEAYNLGTGQGYSVLEVVNAFAEASGKPIPYSIVERRAGDVASCYANPAFSRDKLGWQAQYGIKEMVRDHWNWQLNNPEGY